MLARPFIWAHRGASQDAPENTLAAFRLAERSGADGLELDIHVSRDGVPVVIHDETLDRTTDTSGLVGALTWQQLQTLDAGSWFSSAWAGQRIPGLVEVLREFGDHLRINVEIKENRAGEAVLATLAAFPQADVVVSSFDQELLGSMRRLAPDLALAVLFEHGNWRRAVRLADEIAAVAFHPEAGLVSRPLVAACRACGLPVHTWTVDDVGRARFLMRAGVAGIFTNDPALFAV